MPVNLQIPAERGDGFNLDGVLWKTREKKDGFGSELPRNPLPVVKGSG